MLNNTYPSLLLLTLRRELNTPRDMVLVAADWFLFHP